MKNIVLCCCLFIFISLPILSAAREANVITKNGQVIKGELIGINDGNIYLNNKENQAKIIKTDDVAEVFDSETNAKIDFNSPNSGKQQPQTLPAVGPPMATPAPVPGYNEKRTMIFINGTMQSGLVGYVPCKPLEGTYAPYSAYVVGMQPYDSAWGAGMSIEYKFLDSLAGCFDAGISRWEKLLAKKGGYGVGDWVFEQTGYNGAAVGPFPMDVKYYMDTTIMRMGAKYYPLDKGVFRLFIGAALGIYGWQATIGNRDEEKKYSETSSGYAYSPTYQAGIDLVFGEFALRIFGDFATAVAYPRFENLFQTG
jgi:hypothetical protein